MRDIFILYGEKDERKYYIRNTNPVIWTTNILNAKIYSNDNVAKCDILRDYDNYKNINAQIQSGSINDVYLANLDQSYLEIWRLKLL